MKFRRFLIATILAVAPSLPVSATILTFDADLSPLNENPPNPTSTGVGEALLTIDDVGLTITIDVVFSGLSANDTAAHIHCCVPPPGNTGVATVPSAFPGFPLGVTSGTFHDVFSLLDPTFYNPVFITNNGGSVATAEPVLLTGIETGNAYFNIHTVEFPGGEIRGFITACGGTTGNPCGATTGAPEPATLALLAIGVAGLAFSRRHDNRRTIEVPRRGTGSVSTQRRQGLSPRVTSLQAELGVHVSHSTVGGIDLGSDVSRKRV